MNKLRTLLLCCVALSLLNFLGASGVTVAPGATAQKVVLGLETFFALAMLAWGGLWAWVWRRSRGSKPLSPGICRFLSAMSTIYLVVSGLLLFAALA